MVMARVAIRQPAPQLGHHTSPKLLTASEDVAQMVQHATTLGHLQDRCLLAQATALQPMATVGHILLAQ